MHVTRGLRVWCHAALIWVLACGWSSAGEGPALPDGFWDTPPREAALAWAEASAPAGAGWRLELPAGEAPARVGVALAERHSDADRVLWAALCDGEAMLAAGRSAGWEDWSRTPAPQAGIELSTAAAGRLRHAAQVAWQLTRISARWSGPGEAPAAAEPPLLVLGHQASAALWASDGTAARLVVVPSSPAWDAAQARRAIAALLRHVEPGLSRPRRQREPAEGHHRILVLPEAWRPLVPPVLLGQAALAAAAAGDPAPDAATLAGWRAALATMPPPPADAAAVVEGLSATAAAAAARLGVLVRAQQREPAADAEWIAADEPGWRLAEGRLRERRDALAAALARRLEHLAVATPAVRPATLQHASLRLMRVDATRHRAVLAGLAITRADHPLLLHAARAGDDDAAIRARLRPFLLAALADPTPDHGRAQALVDLLAPFATPQRDADPAIDAAFAALAVTAKPDGWELAALARGLLRRGQEQALAAALARLDAAGAWDSHEALFLLGELVVAGGPSARDAERRLRAAEGPWATTWAPWAAWAAGLAIDEWAGRQLDARLRTAWSSHEVAARLEALIDLAAGTLRDYPDAQLDHGWRRQWARDLAALPDWGRPSLRERLARAGDAPLLRGLTVP
jgi:hypothetical protein